MSLCKKITFPSYKLTGIIAVGEASASCCTLKLWVACCQIEPAAPLSGPVLGRGPSDERQVASAYGGICRVHGARSLLVWPAASAQWVGFQAHHKTHSDFSFHANFQMQIISRVARFLKLSGQELLQVIFLYTFDWSFWFLKGGPILLTFFFSWCQASRKTGFCCTVVLTVQYLLIVLLEAAAASWAS